jgi:hypothetical protein
MYFNDRLDAARQPVAALARYAVTRFLSTR